MRIRVARACGALLMAGVVMSACGSDDGASSDTDAAPAVTDAPVTSGAPVATDAPVSGDDPVTTDAPTTDGSAPAEIEGLCASIPDPAAIEAAIGEAVKEPLDSGDPGYAQGCTLLRAADDFPGITFNFTPDRSIDDQIAYVSTNFGIDIVPLEGVEGFYVGEGNSVYYVLDGDLYQTGATINGDDPQTAAVNMMTAWLGL